MAKKKRTPRKKNPNRKLKKKIAVTKRVVPPQNDRVRAESRDEVPPLELEKFPEWRMAWLGMSSKGLTRLQYLKGTVRLHISTTLLKKYEIKCYFAPITVRLTEKNTWNRS